MRITLLILLLFLFFSSCKKSSSSCEGPDLDCSTTTCLVINYYFEFKITDRTTGADLVFGNNPRYTASDIRLYEDAAFSRPIFLSVDNNRQLFQSISAKETMYLVIMGTDSYHIEASFKRIDCCTNRVKDLRVEGQMVCSCCNDVISVAVD